MSIQWLLDKMAEHCNDVAVITSSEQITYGDILREYSSLRDRQLILVHDFSVDRISLWELGMMLFWATQDVPVAITTSGTTGEPQTVRHQISDLIIPFKDKQLAKQRMIAYLLPDHIGGLNTLLRSLVSGGTLIIPDNRTVGGVCKAIEEYKAEVLPTTPSFLNILLITGTYQAYDLHSLKIISFGTEVMPIELMQRLMNTFPWVRWVQTYGTTELGILHTETHPKNPLLLHFPDPLVYVADGTLWVDGKDTGDMVENVYSEEGKTWMRIIGRKSDIINIGGNKVHPLELEELFLKMNEVDDVVVYGEGNQLLGQIVCAKFNLNMEYTSNEWKKIVWERMREQPKHWKPMKVIVTSDPLYTVRGKKKRGK